MNFNNNLMQPPQNSIPSDKKELIALLKLVKKYNLKGTEELLKQEAGLGENFDDFANTIDEQEVVDVASSADSQVETDFEIYDICFTDLRTFVDESLDIYKHELSLILYPVFAHIYLKLVQEGNDTNRKKFMDKFASALDISTGDISDLAQVSTNQDIASSDLCQAFLQEKYVIRLSRDSQSLIKRHLQDTGAKYDLIQRIVSKHITFDSYEGTARTKAQCDATSGSLIGEARRQDNKIRVYYGLLKEIDFQSLTQPPPPEDEDDGGNDPDAPDKPKKKKPKRDPLLSKKSKSDPNAPPIDRIPLPELKDADKLEKLKALRETAKRVHLNKDTLPSVCFYTVLNSHGAVICTDVSDDASMLAAGFTDSHVKVWSLTPAKLREMKSAESLKDIDKDAEDVLVRMMDDRTAETARTFYGHSGPVFRVAFSPEKNLLLSCSEDTTIRLWSLQTWTCIVVYRGHLFPVWDVRFSPHGYYFVSASHDKTARLWATDMNQPLRIFSGHLSDVDTCQFHPNSNYIATGSSDRTVRLFDCLNGQMVRLMTGHKSTIHCLAFSTCGRYLASGSADNKILVWDLSHGQLVSSLSKHTGTLYTLAFSRDGNILTAGGLDCLLTLWDFSKLTEDHVANISSTSSSHNPDPNEGENYLLRTFPTKNSSFLSLHFTRRNLLISVGVFKS